MRHPLIVGLASLLLACADEHDPEHLSTTTQALGETSSLLTSMSPVGYWRLGESSGGVMTDRSGNQVNGVYSGMAPHYYGMKGAIYGDRDTAMFFDARAANAMIPDRKLYSLTRDWDDFAGALETNSWGPAADGDWWTAQVTTSPFHYLTGAIDGNFVAIINPNGSAGTFQQGRATSLLRGEMQIRATWSQAASGGSLQPVSLVAQRVDNNNFIRAELLETTNHTLELRLIKTVNGTNQYLATAFNVGTYTVGDWWYVRFKFDGVNLGARAWKRGTTQPTTWQVEATQSSATVGTVAVRSANSVSSARPIVMFDDFWVQTTGFSISMFMKLPAPQVGQSAIKSHPFGKAKNEDTFPHDEDEYYFRFHSNSDPNADDRNTLKAYVFNLSGGLGAGVSSGPTSTNYPSMNWLDERWHHVVMMLDAGDSNDTQAGITLYVDGVKRGGAPDGGATYKGDKHCVDACVERNCRNADGEQDDCWLVNPLNGSNPINLGQAGGQPYGGGHWMGQIDEFAIFSRKLTPTEIRDLYNSSCQPTGYLGAYPAAATYASSMAAGFPATQGTDHLTSTRWVSASSTSPQWITIDLGAVREVAGVLLHWEAGYAASYQIQVSNDNVTFSTAVNVTTGNGGVDPIDIKRSARYVRMLATSGPLSFYSMWEFSVLPCNVVQ